MQLNATLQALEAILAAQPDADAPLKDRIAFFKAQDRKAKAYAAELDAGERLQQIEAIDAYIRAVRPDAERKERLLNIQGIFEMDATVLADYRPIKTRKLPYDLIEGYGAAPTAFVRSGLFNGTGNGQRIFKVLGLPHISIERAGNPLGQNHLQTLMLAISLVRDYDEKLGTTVAFKPWDAIRTLGWSKSTQSLKRLKDAIDQLRGTTVRVVLNADSQTEEAAPLIARALTSMDERTSWEVQLTSTLLNALAEYRTFLKFETLAALPNGAASWLYAFLQSEARDKTEWDLEDIAQAAGLTSGNPYEIKRKLKAALETLKAGSTEVKARGKAVYAEGKGELTEQGDRLVVKSTSSTTKTFEPALKAYAFRKTQSGKERVTIER